jgi:pimeloyl-ACP methyl ester carboxylesterase
MSAAIKHIRTASLDVAYEESGNPSGDPVFLMHGWPYDPRDYDDVLPALGAAGYRIIVPARLRRHALSLHPHAALGPASRAWQ